MAKPLLITDAIDENLKLVRDADGTDTSIQLSKDKLKVTGDLDVTGNIKTPNQSTPLSDFDLATKKYVDDNAGGGGTHYWQFTTGGYKTNAANTTYYYMQYYPNRRDWNNSDNSPTTINQYDAPSASFHAVKDGSITNIRTSGYVNDFGATDDFKFYVFKGAVSNDGTNTSLTLIATSDAITASSSAKTFMSSTDISSSNTFSEGDGLWVMLKKDAHTNNTDIYFSITISGEYS